MDRCAERLATVEPKGSLAEVLLYMDDPLSRQGKEPALLLGEKVSVQLPGLLLEDAFVVDRHELQQGKWLHLAIGGNILERREVRPEWSDERVIVIKEGLKEGEFLVTTPIAAPVSGLLLSQE